MKHNKYSPGDQMKGSDPGVYAAKMRNPNKHAEVNGAPDGPYSHCMGYKDDGGMHGDTSASGKMGYSFEFK